MDKIEGIEHLLTKHSNRLLRTRKQEAIGYLKTIQIKNRLLEIDPKFQVKIIRRQRGTCKGGENEGGVRSWEEEGKEGAWGGGQGWGWEEV